MGTAVASRHSHPKLTRREREHQFRLNLVLDAAFQVFAEKSFATATVEDIARRAEISVGTLYKLFENKEEIVKSLVSREESRFFDVVNERVDTFTDPKDKVHATFTILFELFAAVGSQFRFFAMASGAHLEIKQQLADEMRATHFSFVDRLAVICQQGIDAEVFRAGVSAHDMALNLMTIPHCYLTYTLTNQNADLLDLLPSALEVADRITGVARAGAQRHADS